MTIQEACRSCEVLREAGPESLHKIALCGRIQEYQKGELLFRERESVDQMYFLVKGHVALYRINQRNDRKVIFLFRKGEMLNEVILQNPVASISCLALDSILVLKIPRKEFQKILLKDTILCTKVMDSLSIKLRRCYRQLGNTSNSVRLEEQVASKLWKLARDFGVETEKGVRIDFELSITFLADMVGSKRETVSRVVKRLSEKEMISVEKGYFFVKDMEKIKPNYMQ